MYRRAVFTRTAIASEVLAVGRSLGINLPPVDHVFDARDFRPPRPARGTRPPRPAQGAQQPSPWPSGEGHSGWHRAHVESMLQEYPVALAAFVESLPALWATPRGGPVTIVAWCLKGEMRSVCMTRVLAYLLSAFPCRENMDLQVYHLSGIGGHWQRSHSVLCRSADTDAASRGSRGMCPECLADLGDGLAVNLFRRLGFPTLGS